MWLKLNVSPHGFGTNSLKYNVHHQNTTRYYMMYLCSRRYQSGSKVFWPNTEEVYFGGPKLNYHTLGLDVPIPAKF